MNILNSAEISLTNHNANNLMDYSPCLPKIKLEEDQKKSEISPNNFTQIQNIYNDYFQEYQNPYELFDFNTIQKILEIKNLPDEFFLEPQKNPNITLLDNGRIQIENNQNDSQNSIPIIFCNRINNSYLKDILLQIIKEYSNKIQEKKEIFYSTEIKNKKTEKDHDCDELRNLFFKLKNFLELINFQKEKSQKNIDLIHDNLFVILEILMNILINYFSFFREKINYDLFYFSENPEENNFKINNDKNSDKNSTIKNSDLYEKHKNSQSQNSENPEKKNIQINKYQFFL